MNPDTPADEIDAYAFDLPESRIAQQALPQRDAARLMRIARSDGRRLEAGRDLRVRDLPEWLEAGDLLVVNTTRVQSARLRGRKRSGGAAEALLLGPAPETGDAAETPRCYRALVRISGHLRVGIEFVFEDSETQLSAEIVALDEHGEVVLRFEPGPSPYAIGEAPLPPYIRRPASALDPGQRAADLARYQTVYADEPGAVAAPTAGLHLTESLLATLAARGVGRAEVVLHVGLGTFKPLREADLRAGRLHAEHFRLGPAAADAVNAARARGGRVIAVGTTTTRVLETCADEGGVVHPRAGETDLFLRAGSRIRSVDGLLTNFHLPRSSLLMLVAAFIGREPLLAAYRAAIAEEYRFYSYGDAMLIL